VRAGGGRACGVCARAGSSQQLQGQGPGGPGPGAGSALLCGPSGQKAGRKGILYVTSIGFQGLLLTSAPSAVPLLVVADDPYL
jgi:hypothetical protein